MYKVEIRRQNTTKSKIKHGSKNFGPKHQKESSDKILLLFLVEKEGSMDAARQRKTAKVRQQMRRDCG